MADKQALETRDSTEVQTKQKEREQESEVVMRPPADIFEDAEGITLTLDMPGVSRDRLNVSTDQKNLTVEGRAQINMPEGMTALYADVRSTLYRRSFVLNGELMETDKIEASLKDGVLTVHIPKQSELRPRKIEVRVS